MIPVDQTLFGVALLPVPAAVELYHPGVHYIASGKSPRGDFLHSTVHLDGKLVHDPHPSRDGLDGEPTDFEFVVLR